MTPDVKAEFAAYGCLLLLALTLGAMVLGFFFHIGWSFYG